MILHSKCSTPVTTKTETIYEDNDGSFALMTFYCPICEAQVNDLNDLIGEAESILLEGLLQ